MKNISKNITYKEATHSFTAKRFDIENIPDKEQLDNMMAIAEKIFQPLRRWVKGPIKINSFFRSDSLNKALGGASGSQHRKGMAIDIDDIYGRKTNKQMFDWIKANLNFDQLIWEFGDEKNPSWLHVSYINEDKNRNRVLIAEKEYGKTVYKIIK